MQGSRCLDYWATAEHAQLSFYRGRSKKYQELPPRIAAPVIDLFLDNNTGMLYNLKRRPKYHWKGDLNDALRYYQEIYTLPSYMAFDYLTVEEKSDQNVVWLKDSFECFQTIYQKIFSQINFFIKT